MYQNEVGCDTKMIGGLSVQQANLTVVENIDQKIAQLQAEIVRLKASKTTLAPLLGMRIRDIREAMNY
mgnify:FL=1